MSSWVGVAGDFLTTASGAPSREALYLLIIGIALLQIWMLRADPRYHGEPLFWSVSIPYLAEEEGESDE